MLGAILLRPSILRDLEPVLDPSDFYRPQHASIYHTLLQMHQGGRAIDVVTVLAELRDDTTIADMHNLTAVTPSLSSYGRYADIIIETSRRRRLIAHLGDLIQNTYAQGSDIEMILDRCDARSDRLIAPRSAEIADLWDYASFMAKAKEAESQAPWLIPHIMKPRWRCIIVAGEGGGKMVLMRQLALHIAAGRDPWCPSEFIEPVRVLFVDCENPDDSIRFQSTLANTGIDLSAEWDDRLSLLHREAGMNLRERRPQAEFEAVVQRTRPEMVFMGPLYKMYRKSQREDPEQAFMEFANFIDDMRKRYNFGIMIEDHAPKGQGGYRELTAIGTSAKGRWCEMGITLDPMGGAAMTDTIYDVEVGRFRRDRVIADWPDRLSRGKQFQSIAWSPTWYETRMWKLNPRPLL